jgi:hypothetical protein
MVILCRWDADDNTRVAAQLSVKNNHRLDALNQAAVIAVRAMAPVGR